MKKLLLAAFILTVSSFAATDVANASGFNAGRIIDDGVFTNQHSMSVTQIQSFLNSKVPNCDTYGSKTSEYGGGTRAQWGSAHYGQSTFTCLKDYSENGRSAAQIIYDVSQQFAINPQVMIVLLQKEQGLVTDEWPLNIQYRTATGYGCPDTAPCDSQYYGLTNQLTWAARMFRAIMNNSPTWYTPYVLGNNFIQYSPDGSCGGSVVNIENRSTQALYNYTPYQPNAGALAAGWGTAPCGAYGNRNFYLYFTGWFGSTQGGPSYQWTMLSQNVYSNSGRTTDITGDASTSLAPGQTAYVRITARNTGANVWTQDSRLSTTNNPFLNDGTWPAYNLSAPLTSYPIAYNEIGTFDFAIKAPQDVGVYRQTIKMVHNGSIWFPGPDMVLPIDVVNPISPVASSSVNELASNATMNTNHTIMSPEKYSTLSLSHGRLEVYVNFKKVWSAPVSTPAGTTLVNQADGNLVLYTSDGRVAWASNTNGSGPSTLVMQPDGNLVLYNIQSGNAVWASNTSTNNQLGRANYTLKGGFAMLAGQALSTADRRYNLVMQNDGNVVLYNNAGQPTWASGTDGTGATSFVMQNDGNLVIYSPNRAVWASGTDGRGASAFSLQQDGNLVLYTNAGHPAWASNTAGR